MQRYLVHVFVGREVIRTQNVLHMLKRSDRKGTMVQTCAFTHMTYI